MPIISTIEAKCKDCYKCLRACPVKAIRVRGEAVAAEPQPGSGSGGSAPASAPGTGSAAGGRPLYAQVVKERCILDGECLRVCPQKAKKVRADAPRVRAWLEAGETVIATLAPSFAAAFELDDPLRVVGALKALGFAAVVETAVGAELVAASVREEVEELEASPSRGPGRRRLPLVATACPVVVNLMETVYPQALRHASTTVSPMVAHGRLLKRANPGAKVVFVGPCVAKKDEAERPEVAGAVDAALTFVELVDWLTEEGRDLARQDPSPLDGCRPKSSRIFPVEGGLMRTAALPTDLLSGEWLAVSGMDNCRELLADLAEGESPPPELDGIKLIEVLACRGGCVAGPAVPAADATPALRRQRLLNWAVGSGAGEGVATVRATTGTEAGLATGTGRKGRANLPAKSPHLPPEALHRTYRDRRPRLEVPSEAEIKEILARVGKHGPEDELNCGVCGYASCREKAVAVYQGMAESDMCLPYMREMAESMSNLVIATAPYGVVAADRNLRMIFANHAFRTMFRIPDEEDLVGRPLAEIVDDADFRSVLTYRNSVETEAAYPERRLLTHQTIFYLAKRDVVVGLFQDVTASLTQRKQLEQLRGETVARAREVIAKQMSVAQEIAGLLGETTAETKVILTKLIEVINKEDSQAAGR